MDLPKPHTLVVLADVGGDEFHVGDEAMLDANLALLHRAAPGTLVTVLGRAADFDAISDAVADADGVLLSGGGNLSDTWPHLVDQRLILLEEAAERAVPIVTGGQTIGPALSDPQRARLVAGLAGVAMPGAREHDSLALALELGVAVERIDYQVDDAFAQEGTAPTDDALLATVDKPYLAVTLDGSYATDDATRGLRCLAGQLVALAVVPLEVPAGHAVLLRNWLIHRSGVNSSPIPRRAVTICYLDGRTRSVRTGDHFPLVAGTVDAVSHRTSRISRRRWRRCARPPRPARSTRSAWPPRSRRSAPRTRRRSGTRGASRRSVPSEKPSRPSPPRPPKACRRDGARGVDSPAKTLSLPAGPVAEPATVGIGRPA